MKLPNRNFKTDEEKLREKIEAEQNAYIRDGILTSLLIDVAEAFNVKLETVQSGQKKEMTVLVRSIFYYVAKCKTEYGKKRMALVAGRKDHAACIKHLRMVDYCFKHKDHEFLTLWNHYLTNSKLFTYKDFL